MLQKPTGLDWNYLMLFFNKQYLYPSLDSICIYRFQRASETNKRSRKRKTRTEEVVELPMEHTSHRVLSSVSDLSGPIHQDLLRTLIRLCISFVYYTVFVLSWPVAFQLELLVVLFRRRVLPPEFAERLETQSNRILSLFPFALNPYSREASRLFVLSTRSFEIRTLAFEIIRKKKIK